LLGDETAGDWTDAATLTAAPGGYPEITDKQQTVHCRQWFTSFSVIQPFISYALSKYQTS